MKCESGNRPSMRWRQLLTLAGAVLLLQGCADLFVKQAHLKNNPMDQAILTGDEFKHMKVTRERLLKRFPIGRPIAPVERYLESVGAKCQRSSGVGAKVTCLYSQNVDVVLRTLIGDFPEIRSIYTFRIELSARQGRLRDVRVCEQITTVSFKDAVSGRKKRTDYPMECPEGQNTKGR